MSLHSPQTRLLFNVLEYKRRGTHKSLLFDFHFLFLVAPFSSVLTLKIWLFVLRVLYLTHLVLLLRGNVVNQITDRLPNRKSYWLRGLLPSGLDSNSVFTPAVWFMCSEPEKMKRDVAPQSAQSRCNAKLLSVSAHVYWLSTLVSVFLEMSVKLCTTPFSLLSLFFFICSP